MGSICLERSTIRSPSSLSRTCSHGSGCGLDLRSFLQEPSGPDVKFAAVARTRDDAQFRLPCSQATEVSTDGTQREEAFLRADQDRFPNSHPASPSRRHNLRLAGVDDGRRLVQNIRREELVGECRGSGGSDAQRTEPQLDEKGATVEVEAFRRRMFFSSDMFYLGPPAVTGDFVRSGPSMDSIEINPVFSADTRL